MGNQCNSCCCKQDDGTELRDGKVVSSAPVFTATDEEIWAKVDEIFYTYDTNLDDELNLEEIKPYLEELTGS